MRHRYHRIMVVDRDPDFQLGLAGALRYEGVAVLSVDRSDAALQVMAGGYRPDAIVMDFTTEDIGSAGLLRYVKTSEAIPVIALSPGAALWRIGPIADRELRVSEHFDVRTLLAALDGICTPPRSSGPAR